MTRSAYDAADIGVQLLSETKREMYLASESLIVIIPVELRAIKVGTEEE